jgi:predicted GTPase
LIDEFSNIYNNSFEQLVDKSATIVVVGGTGVGKSSLINAVFGSSVAKVGNGCPVTTEFDFFPATEEKPVNLYDSKGWEPQDAGFKARVRTFVHAKMQEGMDDISKAIHCVW